MLSKRGSRVSGTSGDGHLRDGARAAHVEHHVI
jgi:hypothetical protein